MRRSLRQLSPLAAVRGSAVALALVLLLAGCLGAKTGEEHAADYARLIAGTEGLTVESVSCSPNGEVWWTCTGRLQSGREFTLQRGSCRSRQPNWHMHVAGGQAMIAGHALVG
jgi:hypothetical protein